MSKIKNGRLDQMAKYRVSLNGVGGERINSRMETECGIKFKFIVHQPV